MSVPSERNVANKETEKLSKYKDLEIEVNKMWNMKTTTVPVIVGALGLIRKRMNDHVSKIPGRICMDCLARNITHLEESSIYNLRKDWT